MFWLPVLFSSSAMCPVAVLSSPVVLKRSAPEPTPVFWMPVELERRPTTDCRVFTAGGVVHERVITQKCVSVGEVAALLTSRPRLRRKHKACESEQNEKEG